MGKRKGKGKSLAAPAAGGETGGEPGRFSAGRKTEAILRLLHGARRLSRSAGAS
jgi:hypothetical protein